MFIQNPRNEINVIFLWEFEIMGHRSKIILNSLDGRKEAVQLNLTPVITCGVARGPSLDPKVVLYNSHHSHTQNVSNAS